MVAMYCNMMWSSIAWSKFVALRGCTVGEHLASPSRQIQAAGGRSLLCSGAMAIDAGDLATLQPLGIGGGWGCMRSLQKYIGSQCGVLINCFVSLVKIKMLPSKAE